MFYHIIILRIILIGICKDVKQYVEYRESRYNLRISYYYYSWKSGIRLDYIRLGGLTLKLFVISFLANEFV